MFDPLVYEGLHGKTAGLGKSPEMDDFWGYDLGSHPPKKGGMRYCSFFPMLPWFPAFPVMIFRRIH